MPFEITIPLEERRAVCKKRLKDCLDEQASIITSKYSQSERETWAQQEREALLLQQDPNASTIFLETLAQRRGITKQQAAQIVIQKATEFKTIMGNLVARRKELEDEIDNSNNPESVNITTNWII